LASEDVVASSAHLDEDVAVILAYLKTEPCSCEDVDGIPDQQKMWL
jgi:hypothetical protein